MAPPQRRPCRVAVIGAGAAGLCVSRHLSDDPENFNFVVYEQQNEVGGTWRYTDNIDKDEHGLPIHSSMYKNLRTNLPKETMAFPDFPFLECNGKSFLHHSEVFKYLKDYAKKFDLYKSIQFLTLVVEVQPRKLDSGTVEWDVAVLNILTGEIRTSVFDSVMVCNGHYSVPYIPEIQGINNFRGILCHSHSYRTNEEFKNLRVVVLGAGASGIDIAIEVAAVAKEVMLSHNLPVRTCPLPNNLTQEVGVSAFGKTSVTFLNGRLYECDAVILCTGYLYTYPFLHADCHLNVSNHQVMPLYKHLIHIEYPTLAIWSVPKQILPFPIYDQQAIVYLKYLCGDIDLPSPEQMKADAEHDLQIRLSRGMKLKHAHVMQGELQWDYDNQLAELGKISPIPDVVRNLFRHTHATRKKDVLNYKNFNYRISENSFFIID